jgi:hypothetical protein
VAIPYDDQLARMLDAATDELGLFKAAPGRR